MRRDRCIRQAGAILVIACVVGACGGGGESTLESADAELAKLRSGRITVDVGATAGPSDAHAVAVGFTIDGAFDLDGGDEYPLLDMTSTRRLGGRTEVSRVVSDGQQVVAGDGAHLTKLSPQDAAPLRRGDDIDAGVLEGLGIGDWLVDPAEDEGPQIDGGPSRRITGQVDAAAVLSDLAAIVGQVSGQPAQPTLTDEAAERIRAAVEAADGEILVDDDGVPRSMRVEIRFGGDIPEPALPAFGDLAGVTLLVTVDVDDPNGDVAVPVIDRTG